MNPRQLARHCTLERIADWANLFAAAALARRGKSRRPDVEDWWLRREVELAMLREELLGGAYEPGPYHIFTIREPKVREIADRIGIIHHGRFIAVGTRDELRDKSGSDGALEHSFLMLTEQEANIAEEHEAFKDKLAT